MDCFFQKKYVRFFLLLLCACGLSSFLRYENIWDLINYHYYSGFAFWHNRAGYDLAPAIHHSYFNPLLDTVTYLLIKHLNDYPAVYFFFMGIPFACALFLLSLIAEMFLDVSTKKGKISLIFCLLIGATGYGMFFQIGSSTHEITVACFILCSLFLLLKNLFFDGKEDWKLIFLAGFVLGASAGLKMSVNMYCLSTGLTLILFFKQLKHPVRTIVVFAMAGLIGWLTTNGFWAWHLWDYYSNPFGVFFNKIFKSPYFSDLNYNTTVFMQNHRLWDVLFLPFYFVRYLPEFDKTESSSFSDCRWVAGLCLLIAFLVKICWQKKEKPALPVLFLTVWMVVSYLVWVKTVAVVRYAVSMELIFALLAVMAFNQLEFSKKIYRPIIACVVTAVFVSTVFFSYPHWQRHDFDKIIQSEPLVLPDNTLMLLIGDPLSAYVAMAAENAKVRSVTISALWPFPFSFTETGRFVYERSAIMEQHQGPVVALVRTDFFTKWIMSDFAYRLVQKMTCRPFKQQIEDIEILFCRL